MWVGGFPPADRIRPAGRGGCIIFNNGVDGWSGEFQSIEPKLMSTGLARMSAMLAGKKTPREDAIELHEEIRICP
jgi:hypothetical protein